MRFQVLRRTSWITATATSPSKGLLSELTSRFNQKRNMLWFLIDMDQRMV